MNTRTPCDIVKTKCDYCDLLLTAENYIQVQSELKKHIKIYHATSTNSNILVEYFKCEVCVFYSKQEILLKRHKRDKHDLLSASTSPKPKKGKNIYIEEESMEVDEKKEDQDKDKEKDENEDNMDIDDNEEILKERSKMWDEKIKKKRLKEEKEEQEQQKRETREIGR